MRDVGAPAGRDTGHHGREIASGKPDHRVIGIERGHDHLAHFAVGDRIAGARPHDLDEQILVDDHAHRSALARSVSRNKLRFALVGDDAGLGDGIALQHRDAAAAQLLAKRCGQRRARNQPAFDRGCVLAGLLRGVEQNLQKVRRADVARRLEMHDRLELLLGVADAAGDGGAAERVRAGFENVGAGREMVRERVVHDVAGAKAGGEQRAGRAAKILAMALRLEDRTRRHMQTLCFARQHNVEAAERRAGFLQRHQIGFAQQRQRGQRAARRDGLRIDALEMRRPAGRRHSTRDNLRHARELLMLARGRIAGFKRIVMLGSHGQTAGAAALMLWMKTSTAFGATALRSTRRYRQWIVRSKEA